MITHTAQAKNAIKWIDSLKGGKKGYKKGTGELGDNNENPQRYCCLGVACRVLDVIPYSWKNGINYELVDKLGLHDVNGEFRNEGQSVNIEGVYCIIDMNDDLYENDETFTRVRAFILKNLDVIFIPGVAEKLKQHYGK